MTFPLSPSATRLADALERVMPALHFVGFRGDEYNRACRIFGQPDFIHIGWDKRAQREIGPGDVVIFATGSCSQEPARHSFPDIVEKG